jgi:hypothetical protein
VIRRGGTRTINTPRWSSTPAARCGFDVLNIQSIPGLDQVNYADEMHVNASGVPIYTRYIVSRLKR